MAAFTSIALGGLLALTAASTLKKAPKTSGAAATSVETASRKSKKARTALFETEGGSSGQELDAGGVAQRNTLLGN